ncbi:MAG: MMPL family transporter [Actinomycetota bacterium]
MFTSLAHLIVRRRRPILIGSVALFLVAVVLGVGVFSRLDGGGFDDPNSESTRAAAVLEEAGVGGPNIVVVVTATGGDVDLPAVADDGQLVTDIVSEVDGATDVASYWSLGNSPPLRSIEGDSALVVARIVGDETQQEERTAELIAALDEADFAASTVGVGGELALFESIGVNLENDLRLAEMIAIPITLLLLIVIFRGIVAALLPLTIGITAIFGAFFVLWAIAGVTDVSIFSINLVTALGLGLAIDYSLFIVSRFREELGPDRDQTREAIDRATIRTIETAGRTVAFSAMTVAVSLAALLVFPLYFLRSFAYAGVGVIAVAMAASVITLPALLAVLGPRVNTWSFGRPGATRRRENVWGRLGARVIRRPGIVAAATVALLLFVGLPFLNVEFGNADARTLPEGDPARVAIETLENDFASNESANFPIVADHTDGSVPSDAEIEAYAIEVSLVDEIARVDTVTGSYADGQLVVPADAASERFQPNADLTWFEVVPTFAEMSVEGQDIVTEIRDIDPGFETGVAGRTAQLIDTKSAIFSQAPIAGGWIALATFVLLFLMFGSFLVPFKAIVLNSLSLTATFGAMVWIFQEGNLAGLLDFTPTGLTDVSMPILMFAVAFGLSMDYEVFLLSRIKEEYDRTGDNDQAIVAGLAKTGSIVTAAALVLSVTFFAFATSGITFMKLFGFGLGVAVLADAFIVRATLVPALMKLAGDANWWAPAWARSIHDRFGISESAPEPAGLRAESTVDVASDELTTGHASDLADDGEGADVGRDSEDRMPV